MGTRLIIGAILTSLGFITIALCYLGARNPKEPRWTDDMIMESFIIPLAIGALLTGPMLLGEAFFVHGDTLTPYDSTVALSILAAGVAILFMMRIPKRVAAYDALRNAAELQKPAGDRKKREKTGVSTNTLGQGA